MGIGLCRFLSTKSHLFPLAHYTIKSSDHRNKDNMNCWNDGMQVWMPQTRSVFSMCHWLSQWNGLAAYLSCWKLIDNRGRLFIARFTIWLFIELLTEGYKPSLLFLLILNQGSTSEMLFLPWINTYSEAASSSKPVSPSAAEALFHLCEESSVPNLEGRRGRQLRKTTRMLCGYASKESEGPKPNLELNLATVIKDYKKHF